MNFLRPIGVFGLAALTFLVDENTDVVARGARRAAEMAGGTSPITDVVRGGDVARVEYRERDGAMRIPEIRLSGRKLFTSR